MHPSKHHPVPRRPAPTIASPFPLPPHLTGRLRQIQARRHQFGRQGRFQRVPAFPFAQYERQPHVAPTWFEEAFREVITHGQPSAKNKLVPVVACALFDRSGECYFNL